MKLNTAQRRAWVVIGSVLCSLAGACGGGGGTTGSTTYTLTVNSTNPSSGVSVGVSQQGTTVIAQKTTPFSLTIPSGQTMVLSAPGSAPNGNPFSSWSGCTPASTGVCTVTVNANITVTAAYAALVTPTVTVTPSAASITTADPLSVTVAVAGGAGNATATGSVTLTSGTYTSSAAILTSGGATINVPAGSLATGTDTLTVTYTPDSASAGTYGTATGTASVTVTSLVNYVLTVNSTNPSSGVPITITEPPSVLPAVESTSFTLSAGAGQIINLQAPATAAGGAFVSWTGCTSTTGVNCSVTMNANTTVSVNYAPAAYSLTVDSAAPSSGIAITVAPADNNGAGAGSTPFTRTYNAGTQVTLSAPLSSGADSFVSWTGCTSNPSASICDVTMNANTTVTATYNATGITSIAVTPGAAVIGTQQQFTATVSGNGSFSKNVTWSLACPSCGSLSPGTLSSTGLYTTPYPAPASVVITATSTQSTNISGSATVTLNPPATAPGPALAIDVNTPGTPNENPHAINPYVYGMNGYSLDAASETLAHPGIVRWGGDDTSRYNYKNGWTNAASDYYFANFQGAGSMPGGGNFNNFISTNSGQGIASLGTVPVLGWVSNGANACSYNTSLFSGAQTSTVQPYGNGTVCGSGEWADGVQGCTSSSGCNIVVTGTSAQIAEAEVTSTSEPEPDITAGTTPAPGSVTASWADGTWAGGWVNSIATNSSFGNGASGKGVAVWDLDNEPTWWDAVHRDVHPIPFSYDEVTNDGVGSALAIKTADPTAEVSGPVIDYWWAYFYSKQDIENGWGSGPCYQPWSGPTDREAHGGVPLIEYYLQQFKKYSASYGTRLLDYVDIHGYFAPDYPAGSGNSVAFTTAGDTQEQMARMNGTRVFWDPNYTDPNYPQPNYITDPGYTASCNPPAQPPQLIPMLRKWVANDYPGTKTAIDEYNFGGLESINGAVVQADILGIFGREGLDMGALWPSNGFSSEVPGSYAFAMYRNYDGKNSVFGDTYLYATSTASGADGEGQLAVYGAQRSSDNAITVMVINKTYGALTSTLSLNNFTATSSSAQVYQYSNANLNAIVSQPAVTVTPPAGGGNSSTITATFPAQSITLIVIPN